MKTNIKFPLVEAILFTPKEGEHSQIAICTNTSAPGQVYNEISEENRDKVCVLGPCIVSRDGVERMIINSLVHPTLKYLILFSEESLTFAPSTNLLQAILQGLDIVKKGNFIKGGVAASPHYPNLNNDILSAFREEIMVLPIFMPTNKQSRAIISRYLEWLKPMVSSEVHSLLKSLSTKDKIYYDSLNKLIEAIAKMPKRDKREVKLDPKQFQQLQPPKIVLTGIEHAIKCPFSVRQEKGAIRADVRLGDESYVIRSGNAFLLGYSLMKLIGSKKKKLSPQEQILLGMEVGRVSVEIANGLKYPSFVKSDGVQGKIEVPLESNMQLKVDKEFYYRIRTQGKNVSVLCMAFDECEEFFELVSKSPILIAERIAREDRFQDYEMDILHRFDIGTQIAAAGIAAKLGYSFIQDFSTIFKINKKALPFVVADGDSFLDVHKTVLRKIYTEGITDEHGDKQKGLARTAAVLAIYRKTNKSLRALPIIYKQSSSDTETMRKLYKRELLRKDHDGTYTYGERTRSYFGYDQLEHAIKTLKNDPSRAVIVQRFDPINDMTSHVDPVAKKTKYTHDPCLTHDIYFTLGKKLHSFHIARAHNAVNAYPENIFGLYDAYVTKIRQSLRFHAGDMYMLSNRANILLITEEQRTKKILAEPSKPPGDLDTVSGPYLLGDGIKRPSLKGGVAYFTVKAGRVDRRPRHEILDRLENYEGVDTVSKAIDYLKAKGGMHNNPLLTEFYAKNKNSQDDMLAYFQANVYGKKVYATAVFMNRSLQNKKRDQEMCDYLMTRYAQALKASLGDIFVLYINFNDD